MTKASIKQQQKHKYTLYQLHNDDSIISRIRYWYLNDILVFPTVVIERNHPNSLILPAIYHYASNTLYEGENDCVQFIDTLANEVGSCRNIDTITLHAQDGDGEGAPPTFLSNQGDSLLNMFLKLDDTVELANCSS